MSSEMRLAMDGNAYTREEFLGFYGSDRFESKWASATISSPPPPTLQDIADSATNAADNATDAASTRRQIHATEQNSANAAPESTGLQASPQTSATNHSLAPLVLLARADIDVQQALEESEFKPPRSLHRLARDALNEMVTAGVNSDIDRNLEHWFPWRRYIACHEHAYDIIGTGVTHAIAEYIPDTRDSNRGYQRRLDFVIYRTDGTSCRLHPGTRRRNDAKLIFN